MDHQEQIQKPLLTNEEKMARGSAWLTVGNIGSRLIGVVYIIPWYFWLGDNAETANALFGMGYNVYALFIMISTAGIPAAIAKQIAFHNSRGEYRTSQNLLKRALQIMFLFGMISATVMYLASPALSKASGGGDDLVPAMRSLSVAILVIPVMSVLRGYFQGAQNVGPFAISQLVEQFFRVIYMLMATFIIMRLGSGDYVSAVTQSTFAAFIGALGGIGVLLYYFRKEKVKMAILAEQSQELGKIDTVGILVSTVKEAIPFIIVGSAITIFKLVDQFTFIRMMSMFTEYTNQELQNLMALFSVNPDKLTMVVIGLATAMAAVGLPLITESYAQKDQRSLTKLVTNNLQLYSFIMFPATFGMVLLAYPLNTIFYGYNVLGSRLLMVACLSGLVLGLFMISATMLQGIYENMSAVIFFGIGFIVKFLLQAPSIYLLESYGPHFSTTIGLGVACYLNLRKLHQKTHFNRSLVLRRTLLMLLMTICMIVVAALAKAVFGSFLSDQHKIQSFILVMLVAGSGGFAYLYLGLKIRIADKLLGPNMVRLRHKLRIK